MNAYEWMFREERAPVSTENDRYTFKTIKPDGQTVFLHLKDWIIERNENNLEIFLDSDLISWLELCLDYKDEEIQYNLDFEEECMLIDYPRFDFLKSITIEGDITCFGSPRERDQLIGIRGTCSKECPDCLSRYNGYALRDLPICSEDKSKLGTTHWASKYATTFDILKDTFYWISKCKCLDVLIYNFDVTPCNRQTDLIYDYCTYAVQVQGSTIRFIESLSERKKLFKQYSKKYGCVDYDTEEVIQGSFNCKDFVFDKPDK